MSRHGWPIGNRAGRLSAGRRRLVVAAAVLVLPLTGCAPRSDVDAVVADLSGFRTEDGGYSSTAPPGAAGEQAADLYFAGAIAYSTGEEDRFIGSDGAERARAYAAAADEGDCDTLVLSAAVLHIVEERDPGLEQRALACALGRWETEGVHSGNIDTVGSTIEALERLGYSEKVPVLTAEPFEVNDRTDRRRAWQLLSLVPYLGNSEEILEHHEREVEELGNFLNDPGGDALLGEIIAAYRAAFVAPGDHMGPHGPSDELLAWLEEAKGCEGSNSHHRASLDADFCLLRDSW
ncbi:hypothetical protein, partial [Streptomyces alkaliphilus]|uniref:hypothetical protein n=1 Tax=Streptomyces alkaliphilus TaxID=1472722 RepID=UPI00117DE2E7